MLPAMMFMMMMMIEMVDNRTHNSNFEDDDGLIGETNNSRAIQKKRRQK